TTLALVVLGCSASCAFDFDRFAPLATAGAGPGGGGSGSGAGAGGGAAGAGGAGTGGTGGGGGAGRVLWARSFGSEAIDVAEALSFEASGNIWVVGTVGGPVDFGGGMLVPSGGMDLALIKLDPNGDHLTSAVYGDALDQQPLAMAAHGDGVVVGGLFLGG